MAVDLKHEFTRPLVLLLAVPAVLGWVLLGLSSWSTASVQKSQRLQIIEMTDKNEKLTAELARQVATAGALAELETKVASTRDDFNRITQAKSDVQAELTGAQRNLSSVRRDLSDAGRNLQSQTQKLTELQTSATEVAAATPDVEPRASRSSRRGRWSRRGRSSRSYSIISRSR